MDWLLEDDGKNPSIRYLTPVNLLGKTPQDLNVVEARAKLMRIGPVPVIFSHQHPDGYWEKPGPGYSPKYTSTVWSVLMFAQLGADPEHPGVRDACDYILANARAKDGFFTATGTQAGVVHCLQGNLVTALIELGCMDDPRLQEAVEWMA